MTKRVTVLHRGKLAQFDIEDCKNGKFIARLLSYGGRTGEEPPNNIEIHKVGRHWEDQGADQDLVDDIGNAIEHESRAPQLPIFNQRQNDDDVRGERGNSRKTGGKP